MPGGFLTCQHMAQHMAFLAHFPLHESMTRPAEMTRTRRPSSISLSGFRVENQMRIYRGGRGAPR